MSTVRNNKVAVKDIGPSPYWTVKVNQDILTETSKVNQTAARRGKTEDRAQIIPEFSGVMLMDRLGTDRVLVVREGNGVSLAALPLP
jgi:hypothetical protein